jgi:hypothetical protein
MTQNAFRSHGVIVEWRIQHDPLKVFHREVILPVSSWVPFAMIEYHYVF